MDDPHQRQNDAVDQRDQHHRHPSVNDLDARADLCRDTGEGVEDTADEVVVADVDDYHKNCDCMDCVPVVVVQVGRLLDGARSHDAPAEDSAHRADGDRADDDPMVDDGYDGRIDHHLIDDDHDDSDHGRFSFRDPFY